MVRNAKLVGQSIIAYLQQKEETAARYKPQDLVKD